MQVSLSFMFVDPCISAVGYSSSAAPMYDTQNNAITEMRFPCI